MPTPTTKTIILKLMAHYGAEEDQFIRMSVARGQQEAVSCYTEYTKDEPNDVIVVAFKDGRKEGKVVAAHVTGAKVAAEGESEVKWDAAFRVASIILAPTSFSITPGKELENSKNAIQNYVKTLGTNATRKKFDKKEWTLDRRQVLKQKVVVDGKETLKEVELGDFGENQEYVWDNFVRQAPFETSMTTGKWKILKEYIRKFDFALEQSSIPTDLDVINAGTNNPWTVDQTIVDTLAEFNLFVKTESKQVIKKFGETQIVYYDWEGNKRPDIVESADGTIPTEPVEPPLVIPDPYEIQGSIELKLKQKPDNGEMVGITKLPINVGNCLFSELPGTETGISFTEPGEYVIEVVPSEAIKKFFNPYEFKINVLKQPDIIEQEEVPEPPTKPEGSRPIIAQIDKPSTVIPEMVFERGNNGYDSQMADNVGKMPFISYMGSPIQDRDISSVKIFHTGIIPKCTVTFKDTLGLIKKIGYPKDDSTFDVFINARSKNLKSIHMKFKVDTFNELAEGQYSMVGTLHIPGKAGDDLYRRKFGSMKGTSYQVIRSLVKEIGLGFNSNISRTEDEMVWRFNGNKMYDVIPEIIKNSYISDTSFMIGYIDYYYCFNYVDLEKEMKRNISTDVGVETFGADDSNPEKISPMTLTTDQSISSSTFYVTKDSEVNNVVNNQRKYGNKTRIKFYDAKLKQNMIFDIDGTTTDGTKTEITKGKTEEETDPEKYETINLGKLDTDNVHKNYHYANILNNRNMAELSNYVMLLTLPNPNFNLYKYQKINITVANPAVTATDPDKVVWRSSGEWFITEITFSYDAGKFSQTIQVARKELGKTPQEMEVQTKPKDEAVNNEINENPMPDVVSDEGFKPGEIYEVKDKIGKLWWVLILEVGSNGKALKTQFISQSTYDESYVYEEVEENKE